MKVVYYEKRIEVNSALASSERNRDHDLQRRHGTSMAPGRKELNLVTKATGEHLGLPSYVSTGANGRLENHSSQIQCPVYEAAKLNIIVGRS
jgi:hypothetical protein